MKSYKYVDLDGEYVLTEAQIFEEYWEYWCAQMRKVGRESMISRERCLEDWITVNWASEVPSNS